MSASVYTTFLMSLNERPFEAMKITSRDVVVSLLPSGDSTFESRYPSDKEA